MPMGPTAGFEEAALVTGIFNHNMAVSKLARVSIQQLFNIDKQFELSQELQHKFCLGTNDNEQAVTTFQYLFIDAAHQCYEGEGVSPIQRLKKEVHGRMDVICDETRVDECANFINGFLEVMKEDLEEDELAKLVGVYDSTNPNKHHRREGQYVKNDNESTVLQALRESIMGNNLFQGTVVIALPPKKKTATVNNHLRRTPRQPAEYRGARAPFHNTRPPTYADMAKVANEIPTPKPIFNPHKNPQEHDKSPESAPGNKPSEHAQANQVAPYTPQTQELATMTNSITKLVTSFEKVLERQTAMETRQANMKRVLEDRQRANENEQAEMNRQMELRAVLSKRDLVHFREIYEISDF